MSDDSDSGWGRLAGGNFGSWWIDLDENHDGDRWSLQINAPRFYLDVLLDELAAVARLRDYLRTGSTDANRLEGVSIGRCGGMEVCAIQDVEFAARWYIQALSGEGTIHLELDDADVATLIGALEKLIEDLHELREGEAPAEP